MDELGRVTPSQYREQSKIPLAVVLDNIRSMHNVGSIFRTADAFAVEKIYLCGITATPPHKEIEKTALGATGTVKWQYFKSTKDAIDYCKNLNFKIFGVEQAEKSMALNDFECNEKMALVFGNEVYGVEQDIIDVCDGVIEIPQEGTKHSLNISVTVGIVLWEMVRSGKSLY